MLESIATNCNDKSIEYKYSLNICVIDDDYRTILHYEKIYIGRIG